MKVIILSRNDYDFTDDKTGELIKGSNVYYIIGNGIEPIKLSIHSFSNNLHFLNNIKEVPGIYKFDLITTVKKQKLVQDIGSIVFDKKIDLFEGV